MSCVFVLGVLQEEEYRRAQIIATGFALVSSRRFAVQAVCFLCASAGEEEVSPGLHRFIWTSLVKAKI